MDENSINIKRYSDRKTKEVFNPWASRWKIKSETIKL